MAMEKSSILDLTLVARSIDAAGNAAPSVSFAVNNGVSPAMISAWIAWARLEMTVRLLSNRASRISNAFSVADSRGDSIAGELPESVFNPETWIPYQLAQASSVQICIYGCKWGALVRTLDLGHQYAGIYQNRSRAVYWDGKNEIGEPVASGVYFYTLTAGDFTATRKMLIRK